MAYLFEDWTLENVENNEEVVVLSQQKLWSDYVLARGEEYTDAQGQTRYKEKYIWIDSGWRAGLVALIRYQDVSAFCVLPAGQAPDRPADLDDDETTLDVLQLGVLGTTETQQFDPIPGKSYADDPSHPVESQGIWRLVREPVLAGYENQIMGTMRWRCRFRSEGQIVKRLQWQADMTLEKFLDGTPVTAEESLIIPGSKQRVNFIGNGGTASALFQYFDMGKPYGNMPTASWQDHSFDGWFTSANADAQKVTSQSIVTMAKDRTLYAHWSEG